MCVVVALMWVCCVVCGLNVMVDCMCVIICEFVLYVGNMCMLCVRLCDLRMVSIYGD